MLLDHPPKVVHREFGNRGLAGNRQLPLNVNEVGIYVVFNILLVLLLANRNPCGLERHKLRVPIELELFWVLVELVDMVLCLGHEGDQFELGGKAPFHPFEAELDGGDLLAEVPEVLVFSQPFARNIIIEHLQSNIIEFPIYSFICAQIRAKDSSSTVTHSLASSIYSL